MEIYINAIWATIGLIVAVFGFGYWKKTFKGLAEKTKTLGLADTEGFIEFFGKCIVFLGMLTLASSVICINSPDYLSVSISLQVMAVVYFVLEAIHLYRKYKDTPPKKADKNEKTEN